ncbi:hypothetical protein RQP46_000876 [Phenoliferia psychrophenolica]
MDQDGVRFDRERYSTKGGKFPPLEELVDRDRLWPPDLNTPLCSPKIYVYDLPPHLGLPTETISQCRWSAYNSELLLHSLLIQPNAPPNSPAASLVTTDPSEADLFFIPLFPSCYLFKCWVAAGWKKDLRCDVEDKYILPAMEWVKAQGWWGVHGGADHILVHPMDFVDGYYTEEARAAMNSSIYLVTVGDLRPPPHSIHYRRHHDIVLPSSTHLLNSYYINPRDYVNALGHRIVDPPGSEETWRKSKSTPTHVEIFEPSPTWVAGISNGSPDINSRSKSRPKTSKRTTTAIFRGGVGRPGEGESYALGIRSLFYPTPASTPPSLSHVGFSSLPHWDIAEASENDAYAKALARSKFGLAPPGYTLDTTRIWEYLAFGVVPVFIGTGPTGGQVMPFQDDVDYAKFSISVAREHAHRLPEILATVSEGEYERLRRNVWKVGRLLVLEGGRGNVWRWLERDLCRMRGIGRNTTEIKFT